MRLETERMPRDHATPSRFAKERGAVLVISLIILMLLTILGITSMRSSVTEEKMSDNNRDHQRAFQAAESTLRYGEEEVENRHDLISSICGTGSDCSVAPNPGDQCPNGLCTPAEHDPNYDSSVAPCSSTGVPDRWVENCPNSLNVWSTAGEHITYANTNQLGLVNSPELIIEFLGFQPPSGQNSTCWNATTQTWTPASAANWPYCPTDPPLFRITALAYGGTKGARVMLQETYLRQ